ncbi:MAG: hypothetical protein AB1716_19035, partial [Planctomycetota bacterium]
MTLRTALAFIVAAASIAGWYVAVMLARPAFVGDEYHHVPVARAVAAGEWRPARDLPMPPTFHWIAAQVLHIGRGVSFLPGQGIAADFGATGGRDLWLLRAVNPALGLIALLLVASIPARFAPNAAAGRMLRLAWHPLLLPLWAFVYTEVAALLGILIAVAAHARGRRLIGAAGLLFACAVRQTSVVWAAFFVALAALEMSEAKGPPRRVGRFFRQAWPYLVVVVAGGVWAVAAAREGLAKNLENRAEFNRAQLYMFALVAAVLWLPAWVAELPAVWRGLGPRLARGATIVLAIAAVALLELAFRNPHPWNTDLNYLRDWPLVAMMHSAAARYAVASVVV